jgi:hypothetical protein
MSESNNKNKGGMIVLVIFLLICSGLGIAAFTMSFTKKCGEGFDTGNFCVSCGDKATESTGPMGSAEGASSCITMTSWLSSPSGVKALQSALTKTGANFTPDGKFNINGSATNLTGSQKIKFTGSGGNVYLTNWSGSQNNMKSKQLITNPMGVSDNKEYNWEPWQTVTLDAISTNSLN